MFVAFAIECFAKVEHLLPNTELDFHGSTGAVDRGELTHIRLFFTQVHTTRQIFPAAGV